MQQQRRRSGLILGLVALGGLALTAGPAPADSGPGPYYAEPAWSQQLPIATRFVVLTDWNNDAVLDKETGLVWERSPSTTNNMGWQYAKEHCTRQSTGFKKGWRLPSVFELTSLVSPGNTGPALPTGHPFSIVMPIVNVHWSATTNAETTTQVWFVNFHNGQVAAYASKVNGLGSAWCVRGGGMDAAAY